jgi:hypothetical protein
MDLMSGSSLIEADHLDQLKENVSSSWACPSG